MQSDDLMPGVWLLTLDMVGAEKEEKLFVGGEVVPMQDREILYDRHIPLGDFFFIKQWKYA